MLCLISNRSMCRRSWTTSAPRSAWAHLDVVCHNKFPRGHHRQSPVVVLATNVGFVSTIVRHVGIMMPNRTVAKLGPSIWLGLIASFDSQHVQMPRITCPLNMMLFLLLPHFSTPNFSTSFVVCSVFRLSIVSSAGFRYRPTAKF